VRVVIAEDLALLRDGLTRLLRDNGFDVVAAVVDGDALIRAVTDEHPDIAIVDIRLPPSFRDEGVRVALELRRRAPDTAILVVSQYVELTYAQLFSGREQGPLNRLTPREREVLSLMAEGRSNAGIAESLVLTVGAVEKHVANILMKLRLPPSESDHRRVLAVLAYLQDRGQEE
jgi:DNA-binding NarL/FixJ family response regulator